MTEWVNFTDNFRLVLENLNEKESLVLKEMFLFYRNEYESILKKNPGEEVSATYTVLKKIDQFVKETLETHDRKSNCKKGCTYCCHTKIAVSTHEVKLLVQAIKEAGIDINLAELKTHNGVQIDQMPYEMRKCPLLGDDGACRVYEYRPGVCRLLNVASDPKLCDTHTVAEVERMISVDGEAIISGMWSSKDNKEVDNIQRMLYKELTNGSKNTNTD